MGERLREKARYSEKMRVRMGNIEGERESELEKKRDRVKENE